MDNLIGMLVLTLLLFSSHAQSQEELSMEVIRFVKLLTQENEPSLAGVSRFSGECGGESELEFLLKKCKKNGWEISSTACIDYSNSHCVDSDNKKSLKMLWVRKKFSTKGKQYQLGQVYSQTNGFNHNLIEIKIGNHDFLLFQNTAPYKPTALNVGIYSINGILTSEYIKQIEK